MADKNNEEKMKRRCLKADYKLQILSEILLRGRNVSELSDDTGYTRTRFMNSPNYGDAYNFSAVKKIGGSVRPD